MDTEMHMELEQLERQVENVDTKVSLVLQLLKGNELDREDSGFIGVVNKLEERVEKLERFKARAINIGIGMALPTGFGVAGMLYQFIKTVTAK